MPVSRISKEDLKLRLEGPEAARPTILDARLKYPFGHSAIQLPGALRVAPGSLDAGRLPRDRDVVVYDSDPEEVTSTKVATELVGQGFSVAILKGGIAEWAAASFPVDTKSAPKPAPAPAKA